MPKASAHPKSASLSCPVIEDIALPASYEEAMQELDALVRRLESGEMPLDQLLSGYQRGAALLQFCRDKLQAVEDQIKVLDDGALKTWKAQ
jgi:exodeoxyribonuclease VII small subunit